MCKLMFEILSFETIFWFPISQQQNSISIHKHIFSFYFNAASVVFKNTDLFGKKQYYSIFQFSVKV